MKRLTLAGFIAAVFCVSPAVSLQERASANTLSRIQELMQTGDYDGARKLLHDSPQTDPDVLRLLLELSKRDGDERQTTDYARRLLGLHNAGRLKTSADIGQAALAAWQLEYWHDANRLFIAASKAQPASLSMFVDWGNLFLEKYNAAEAETIFQDALELEVPPDEYSRWGKAEAYVGLARALSDQYRNGANEALEQALELNPENLPAIAQQALFALQENDWDEAEKWIKRGLARNPNYVHLLELKCALEYFRGDLEEFETTRENILRINPGNGDLFQLLGDLAGLKRRLEDAVQFYREAMKRNPRQWAALASLGNSLLRLGAEEEGKRHLEAAYAADPFNIWTVNTLRLIDSFDRFSLFETERFRIRLHKDEVDALRPYVTDLLERSLSVLERKYNHRVSGKFIFEMYPDHADFAVRTLGLPGLGALGAAFGRVVAMDSPSARPRGEFHWGSTLWHEMAHVVILSLSNHKIPRWFTEGISMMEERQAGEGWGDYLNINFIRAYEKDELLPLADLDAGFERPKSPQQVSLSYFQAGWVCEFLASRYGFEKIREMVVSFGKGLTAEDVFQRVLGESIDEVDRRFRDEMDRTLKPLLPRIRVSRDSQLAQLLQATRGRLAGEGVEDLRKAWEENPDNYFANLELGRLLKAEGKGSEAIPYLEKAIEIFPTMAGADSPYPLLIEAYEETGNSEKILDVRRRWWKMSPNFLGNAHHLANLYSERDQLQEAAKCLEEAMFVNPLEVETHRLLGELYLESNQAEKAIREFKVMVALQPSNKAGAHYKLAQAFFEAGNRESARQEVLRSLEIAPGYTDAQKLLLKLVQQ